MPGTFAANFKEGSRSEILADYLFSLWGAVSPVRRQDDFGIDLFCALSDRIGRLGVVSDYFAVQVKSGNENFKFNTSEEVNWLVTYPTPLFLAYVDKKQVSVSVYHVMPRFYLWALGRLPGSLELTRGDGKTESSSSGLTVRSFLSLGSNHPRHLCRLSKR